MTDWQSSTIAVDGIALHVTRTGGAKPPLVLLHGVTDSGLCWSPVAEALAPTYDLIMLDARGHGHSDAPEAGYDQVTMARDVAGVIAALGLAKPLLMGHSMGAVTALVTAARYPDVPRAVVLEDPPAAWVQAPDADARQRAEGIRDWILQLKSKSRAQILAEGRAQNPRWSEAELAPWADSKVQVSAEAMQKLFATSPWAGIDWDDLLPRITCPVLVITSDPALGAVLTPDGVGALRARVPPLQVAHIAGAGHNIRREQFGQYMDVVTAFLANPAEDGQVR